MGDPFEALARRVAVLEGLVEGFGVTDAGALPIASGGTGAITAAAARSNLGLGSLATLSAPLAVASGGTGSTTAAAARTALGLGSLAVLNTASAATIDNRTRRVWADAMQFFSPDHAGTSVLGASFPNYAVTKPLNVGAASPAWYGWMGVPQDYAADGVWKLYICGDGTAANDAVIDFHVKSLSAGVVSDSADIDSIDNVLAISGTANTLSVLTVSDATGVAAGEMSRISLVRDTGHASDTYAGACYFVGLAFEYTADM